MPRAIGERNLQRNLLRGSPPVRDVQRPSNEIDRLKEALPSATALSREDAREIALAIRGTEADREHRSGG